MEMTMKMKGYSALLMAALLLAASGLASARDVVVSSDASYRAGSAEHQAVVAWLFENAEFSKGKMIGDLSNVGDVKVSHTRRVTGAERSAPGDEPPVPLPGGASPGDEVTISYTSGGYAQTWTYRWVSSNGGGRWLLVRYEYFRVNPQ